MADTAPEPLPALRLDADNPWPSLAAFPETAVDFFRGRDAEIEELWRNVRRSVLTVLYGVSGLGKTSLLQAGLCPRLRANGLLPVLIRLDHSRDAREKDLLAQVRAKIAAALANPEFECSRAPLPHESLWGFFHQPSLNVRRRADGRTVTAVLIFDQLEEIFTLEARDEDAVRGRRAFFEEIAALVENRVPPAIERRMDAEPAFAEQFDFNGQTYRVALSLREDFLPQLLRQAWQMPSVRTSGIQLLRMSDEQARSAVSEAGHKVVEPGVARDIVAFVAGESAEAQHTGGHHVNPVLLSLVCSELNEERKRAGLDTRITRELLERRKTGILAEFYERCFGAVATPVRDAARAFVEESLLTPDGLRENIALTTALSDLAARGVGAAAGAGALETLRCQRLVQFDVREGQQRIEMTHDILTAVAAGSRTERRAREERAESERRERLASEQAAIAQKKLAATRRRAALFAVLAAAGIVAAFIAVRMADSAKLAEQVANEAKERAERQTELTAEANKEIESKGEKIKSMFSLLLEQNKTLEDGRKLTEKQNRQLDAQNEALQNSRRSAYTAQAALSLPEWEKGRIGRARQLLNDSAVVIGTDPADDPRAWEWDYVSGLCELSDFGHKVIKVFKGSVSALAVRPGKTATSFCAGCDDGTVKLFDIATGAEIRELRWFDPTPRIGVSWKRTKEGNFPEIATIAPGSPASEPGQLQVGDRLVAVIGPDGATTDSGKLSDDEFRSRVQGVTGTSVTFKVARAGGPDPLTIAVARKLVPDTAGVGAIAFSPDGSRLVSGNAEGHVIEWNPDTGLPIREFGYAGGIQPSAINQLAFSADGRWLAAYGPDQALLVLDMAAVPPAANGPTPRFTDAFSKAGEETNKSGIAAFAMFPPGTTPGQIAIVDGGGTLRLWDIETGKVVREFDGIKKEDFKEIRQLSFSPDARQIAALMGSTLRVVDLATPEKSRVAFKTASSPFGFTFSPDSRYIATTDPGGQVSVRDVTTGKIRRELRGHEAPARVVAFNQDGMRLISAGADATARVWDLQRTPPLKYRRLTINSGASGIAFSPDGRSLAVTSPFAKDPAITIYDPASGRLLRTIPGITWRMACAPQEPWLACSDADGSIRVVNYQTGKDVHKLTRTHAKPARRIEFGRDGVTLGFVDENWRAWTWDFTTNKSSELGGDASGINRTRWRSIALSPVADLAAVASLWDSTLAVFDLKTGKERWRQKVRGYELLLRFSPDGKAVLYGGVDGPLTLYDIASGKVLTKFSGHSSVVYDAAFTPDGRRLLSVGEDNTSRLWEVTTGRELAVLDDSAAPLSAAATADGSCLAAADGKQVFIFDAAIFSRRVDTRSSAIHLARAGRLAQLKQWNAVEKECSAALALDPSDTSARRMRADPRAELGNLKDAEKDFEEIVRHDPANSAARYHLALLQLHRGDRAAFAETRRWLIANAKALKTADEENRAAWSAAVLPGDSDEVKTAVVLARQSVSAKSDYASMSTLGSILIRSGECKEGIEILKKAMSEKPIERGKTSDFDGTAFDWIFLAVAEDAERNPAEAEKRRKQALDRMAALKEDPLYDDPNYNWAWSDRMELEFFLKEFATPPQRSPPK